MPALQCARGRECHGHHRTAARPRHGLRGPLVRRAVDDARNHRDDPRQLRILARVDPMGAASGGQISRGPARPAGVRRVVGAEGLRLHGQRAGGRHRALSRCPWHRVLPPDRRQVRRIGLHAIRQRAAASPALALPVRIAGARQRNRQCRRDPPQRRAAMGGRNHARAARQRGVRGADPMVGGRAHGQDRADVGVRRRRRRGSTWSSRPACRGSPRRP